MIKRIASLSFLVLSCLILFCLALPSCGHLGQRLLHIEIELDGQVTFEGIRGVPDNMPVDEMWDVLGDVHFEIDEDAVSHLDALTQDLTGSIVVRIKHVDDELGMASLSSLSLSREAIGSSWLLGDGETDRVKRASAK